MSSTVQQSGHGRVQVQAPRDVRPDPQRREVQG